MNIRSSLILRLLLLSVACCAAAQSKAPKWVPLPMELPAARLQATVLGAKPASDVLHLSVGLLLRDEAGLKAFVDSVSDPNSPNYRHFIGPDEVGRRFGLPMASVQKVADYLTASGMKIRLVSKNRLSILADATVAQAQAAFNTTIQEYLPVGKANVAREIRFSFTTPPSVPAEIRSLVTMVGGLENFTRPKAHTFFTPDMLRTLYAVEPIYSSGYQGQGRTVAISNWDGYQLSNIPIEYEQFNLPTPAGGVGSNVTVVPIDGQNGSNTTPQGEGDIDIQCVLAMSPLCNLMIYDDAGDGDLLGVVSQEADDNKADIVTESYGWASGNTPLFVQVHAVHLSMSAQGITYLCASGDTGAEGVPGDPYPDEDPEVLVVGGTSAFTDGSGNRTSEVVWNDETGAGGGGWSANSDPFNVLPSYQKGNGVPTNIPFRLIPDIAMNADPDTGYEIVMGGELQDGWGGTSCASPTTAGGLADVEQELIALGALPANSEGKQRFGRIQDLLYSYNGDPTVFYDVTSGDDGTLPSGDLSSAGPGWDTASGWGALSFNGLADKVLNIAVPSSLTAAPGTVVGGTPITGTVTLSRAAPAGGTVLVLQSDTTTVATVPASVTVGAGATSATFTISTVETTASSVANISATAGGVVVSAAVTVNPSGLTSMTISPSSVAGGSYSSGTVTLNGPAPAGGLDISLSSSNSIVTVPQHVEIAAGQASDSFSIATGSVSTPTTVTITASYGGNSVSATITVGPPAFSGITVSPASVVGGGTATATVTMSAAAPSTVTVSLSSSSGAATLPSSVSIPAGATSATVTVSTLVVTTDTPVTLTASSGGASFTAPLTVLAAKLSSLTLSPGSVPGGSPSSGVLTLSGAAPSGGLKVSLTSSNGAVTVPASITVAAGASSATFTASTSAVATSTNVTISAAAGGVTVSATLTVLPATLTGLSVSPSSVGGGASSTGTVTLSGPAPASGAVIGLLSNSSSATVPSSVTVPAGASSATFKISTTAVVTTVTATISGSLGTATQAATLTVLPVSLVRVTVLPAAVSGGAGATGTVTLNGAAPSGGMVVPLSSSSASASVPTSVTVSAGATSASFPISTSVVTSGVTAVISATQGGVTVTANLLVQTPLLMGITVTPSTVFGGNTAAGVVLLTRAAPSGGALVAVASNSANVVVPSAVLVPSGATLASFIVQTGGVATASSAIVSATLFGTTATANLTLQPAVLAGLTIVPSSVRGGNAALGTVLLNGAAPTGGLMVGLVSSKSAASVPASVQIAAGASSATFAIGTKAVAAVTSATITGTLGGVSQGASLQITPTSVGSLTVSSSSFVGGSDLVVTGTVTLNGAAVSAGDSVVLKSSNTRALIVPGSVRVSSGGTSATFTVHHLRVTSVTAVEITATFGGVSQTATVILNPFQIVSLGVAPATVNGGASVSGTVELNAMPGPYSGSVVVSLKSSSASATTPASVSVPVGATTGAFKVGTKAVLTPVTATITATCGASSQQASLAIEATALVSVSVTPGSVKGSSTTTVMGTVTLSGPAPAGGAVVKLSSSSASAASVPVTVTVPAGRSSATFRIAHKKVASSVSVMVTASLAGVVKTAPVTVTP